MTDDDEQSISMLMHQRRETPKARFMAPNSARDHRVWLPKSQIEAKITSEADVWLVFMPHWLAERADLLQFVFIEEDAPEAVVPALWTRKLELD